MKYAIKIHKILTVDTLPDAWSEKDFKELLDRFDFPNAESTDLNELKELLFMAISDFEPDEAARIVLDYKLSSDLTPGQIDQLSHEMLLDKISEEYPEIHLHQALYNVNQLLFKAYNGKFPNTKATIVDFEIKPLANAPATITKEITVKCFAKNLVKNNVALRLFGHQLNAEEEFEEANDILWELCQTENGHRFITSEYWMEKDEFLAETFEATIQFYQEES
ncbi:hypothetical protein GCM10011416_18520 [Polaribacter pacificus]|uniref:Uncharacterized protein n=1 Tax=Polaribacter pacificus TaxID=1775173 RepID=A0A917HZV6_9FLAO|nr:hypothetical protein [Polaribacter pacificus]GGH00338.1 hypothetical protein GCM10011416_18520 [Polaribacter pacificus]